MDIDRLLERSQPPRFFLSFDLQGEFMTREQELLAHSERCAKLAENCLDHGVAKHLWRLALDYQLLAKQPAGPPFSGVAARPETSQPCHPNHPELRPD
jgi:hypothetical protein